MPTSTPRSPTAPPRWPGPRIWTTASRPNSCSPPAPTSNTADEYGETPLTLACANGDAALVEKLLKAGADANAARWDGETALMIAAERRQRRGGASS